MSLGKNKSADKRNVVDGNTTTSGSNYLSDHKIIGILERMDENPNSVN